MLEITDNQSRFIQGAIEKELEHIGDHKFIDQQIKNHEQDIKDLRVLKKTRREDSTKVKEILQFGFETYLRDRVEIEDHYNVSWIKARILPALKDNGCNYYKAVEILENWKQRR